ncbi:MAG TPA: PPOX class F420-dependent oxidoreductase [Thermoleophilaceae bacterium]
MPKPPLPSQLEEFLTQPNPAVIASLRPDGSPHTAATWYLWEGGRVLVNMDESRKRLEYIRADPRVSITVMGRGDDWYHHVTLVGRASLEPDPALEGIDRICRHYMGDAYSARDQRRVSAWIQVESWHSWAGGEPWMPSD